MFIIIYDFSMAVLMFLFGIYFYKSKGKAARFLSGYNMKSEEERKKYDENAMCKAYGKRMMVMSLPFIVGIIIDIQYQGTGCLIACRDKMVCERLAGNKGILLKHTIPCLKLLNNKSA